jgi:hypothetical protein
MSATIEQKVKNIIADQLGVGEEEIKPGARRSSRSRSRTRRRRTSRPSRTR